MLGQANEWMDSIYASMHAMNPERIIQSGFVNRFNGLIDKTALKRDLFKN